MSTINGPVSLTRHGSIAVITADNPPVNALSHPLRKGLIEAVSQARADDAVTAILIVCAGRTYFAGFDISEFDAGIKEPGLNELIEVIERSPKPVVTAIHGSALGGGLEVAMGCHYRVAVASARLGLPEVNLGLLPGAGGTQRLPRIIGAERALDLITSGRAISGDEALTAGLVDRIVGETTLLEDAVSFAKEIVAEGRPLTRISERDDMVVGDRGRPSLFEAFRRTNEARFRGFNAPENIIQAIEAAVNLPFAEGMKVEERLFYDLYKGDQSAAQRYGFFAERQAARISGLPRDTALLPVGNVGVVGAGTMGGGIAMNFLNVGIPVTLVELRPEALERGVSVIRSNYETSARKGRLTSEEVEARMALLKTSLSVADLADCDLVIEAVFENLDVKRKVFAELDTIIKPGAILASNTSYLDLNAIAAATTRPESVVGLHFFSPANVMKMLEVVRGEATSDAVLATVMKLARTIGKIPVMTGVCHGFIANRIFEQRQKEADRIVLEGAMPWDVDRVISDFGMMGHFAMCDLVGLDVIGWDKETTSGSSVLELLNEAGRHGQKSGKGYYDYDEKRRATPSPVSEAIIRGFTTSKGIERRAISDKEIADRCLYPMIREAALILEEGIAQRASDIDVAVQYGYGWPRYRGGPMFEADRMGAANLVKRLQELEELYGPQFAPTPLMLELAHTGGRFRDWQHPRAKAA